MGERQQWPPMLFSHAPGAASLVGIAWLAPVFGVYFGASLASSGTAPRARRVLGFSVLAMLPVPLAALATYPIGPFVHELATAAASMLAAWIVFRGWPALGRVLLAYGLAARIPVVIVALAATLGDWGTHYDTPPPTTLPPFGKLGRWVLVSLVPQLTFWLAFTMVAGACGAAAGLAVMRRGRATR